MGEQQLIAKQFLTHHNRGEVGAQPVRVFHHGEYGLTINFEKPESLSGIHSIVRKRDGFKFVKAPESFGADISEKTEGKETLQVLTNSGRWASNHVILEQKAPKQALSKLVDTLRKAGFNVVKNGTEYRASFKPRA